MNKTASVVEPKAGEPTQAPIFKSTALKILTQDDDTAIIGGYGVVFGGVDLEGETFTKDTDYRLRNAVGQPVHIDHTMDAVLFKNGTEYHLKAITDPVGEIVEVEPDDFGLWMELQFSKSDDYWEYVEAMVNTGRAGLSTGSNHTARKSMDGVILYWPLNEVSITMTPAEPRTAEHLTRLKTAEGLSEASGEATNQAGIEPAIEPEPTHIEPTEPNTMSEEIKQTEPVATEAPAIDYAKIAEIVNGAVDEKIKAFTSEPVSDGGVPAKAATVNYNRVTRFGDDEVKATAYFLRTGDESAIKANDTIGNVTTAADGANAVPVGHYNGIIAKRDEQMLATQLGVMNVPGTGLTVNVPVDNATLASFAATSEQVDAYTNNYNRDMPAIGQVQMTLAKYGTKIALTEELLADEDSRLLAFIENYIARDMARQHNALFATEILANGTAGVTAAGTTAVTAAEVINLEYALEDEYLDNACWVMARGTEGSVRGLQGDDFLFQSTPAGRGDEGANRVINGYPVKSSAAMPAMAASAKAIAFGNFSYVGMRDGNVSFLRDPYTTDGIVYLKYSFRTVYKVLQAEAVQYLTMAAS